MSDPSQSPYPPPPEEPRYGPPSGYEQPSQQQYGQQPGYPQYGQQPYTGGWTAPSGPPTGRAIAALVLGVVAVIGCWIPFLGLGSLVIGAVAVVLGLLVLRAAKQGRAGGTAMAVVGLVLGGISVLVALLVNTLLIIGLVASDSGSSTTSGSTSTAEPFASGEPFPSDDAAPQEAPEVPGGQFPGQTEDDVVVAAGETATVGDLELTSTPLEQVQVEYVGTQYCTQVSYRNTGSETVAFGPFDWNVLEPAGASRGASYLGDDLLDSGDLTPGGTVSGNVCFDEDAVGAGQDVVLFEPLSIFDEARGAWVNTVG